MTLACTRVHCTRAAKPIIHGKIRFSVLPLCTHGSCTGSTEDTYQIYYRYLYLLVQVPDLAFGGYYIGKEYLLRIIA